MAKQTKKKKRSKAGSDPAFADPAKTAQRAGTVGSGSMGEKPKPSAARRRK